jgi:hypothetical protein
VDAGDKDEGGGECASAQPSTSAVLSGYVSGCSTPYSATDGLTPASRIKQCCSTSALTPVVLTEQRRIRWGGAIILSTTCAR